MITKTIQRSDDLYIQFTNEELTSLGIEPGEKLSWEIKDDSVVLKKLATLEVDISEWSRDILEMLIVESVEKDISVNDVIANILEEQLNKLS
jgi:hypothetical protein